MSLACATDKLCRVCGRVFHPFSSTATVCGPVCGGKYGRGLEKARKDKAKQERAQTKARKEKIKTRSQWISEAQAAVNKYARLRDIHAGRNCISCGAPYRLAGGGAFDAGHFRSVGSAPHMRFYLPQIRLQCVRCNRHLGGNAVEYRRRLVIQYGHEMVEQIEAMQFVAKWDIEYLRRLKRLMTKKAKRLEKRHAMQG